MIESFLNYLNYERRNSPHTVSAYSIDLNQFHNFLIEHHAPILLESVSHPHIRSWIGELVEQKIDSRSINRKLAALRAFYKFLLKKELVSKDPTLKIRPLKFKKQLPHFVEEQQMLGLLNSELESPGEFEECRDRLILELFYGTGIRLAEIIGLSNKNISFVESTIKVLGKRNKERIIPVNPILLNLIKDYNQIKENEFPNISHDFLIVTYKGAPAYPEMVYRVVKKKLNQINNLDKRSPHVLRHTFATHLLDKGADLNAIKDLLGHTSLAATQVYTHNSLEKLKSIFNQAHPKA